MVVRTALMITFFCIAPFIVASVFVFLHGPIPDWLIVVSVVWLLIAVVSAWPLSKHALPYAAFKWSPTGFSLGRAAAYVTYAAIVASIPLFIFGFVMWLISVIHDPNAPFNLEYVGPGLDPRLLFAVGFGAIAIGGAIGIVIVLFGLPKLFAFAVAGEAGARTIPYQDGEYALGQLAELKGEKRFKKMCELYRNTSDDAKQYLRVLILLECHALGGDASATQAKLDALNE